MKHRSDSLKLKVFSAGLAFALAAAVQLASAQTEIPVGNVVNLGEIQEGVGDIEEGLADIIIGGVGGGAICQDSNGSCIPLNLPPDDDNNHCSSSFCDERASAQGVAGPAGALNLGLGNLTAGGSQLPTTVSNLVRSHTER